MRVFPAPQSLYWYPALWPSSQAWRRDEDAATNRWMLMDISWSQNINRNKRGTMLIRSIILILKCTWDWNDEIIFSLEIHFWELEYRSFYCWVKKQKRTAGFVGWAWQSHCFCPFIFGWVRSTPARDPFAGLRRWRPVTWGCVGGARQCRWNCYIKVL